MESGLRDPEKTEFQDTPQEPQIKRKIIADEFIDLSFLREWKKEKVQEGVFKYSNPHFLTDRSVPENIPMDQANINIIDELRYHSGELIDKYRNRKEKRKIKLNSTEPEWKEKIYRSLIKGEEAWFEINQNYQTSLGVPQQPDSIFWKITLDYVKNIEKQLETLDFDGRVKKILIYKENGNNFLKNDNFEKAIEIYKSALGFIGSFPNALKLQMSSEQKNYLEEMIMALKNNSLLAHLKAKSYGEGIKLANDILSTNKINSKAITRKIACLIGKMDFSQAKSEIDEYLKMTELGQDTKTELNGLSKQCINLDKSGRENMSEFYRRIFEKTSEESEKDDAEKRMQFVLQRKLDRSEKEREKELGIGNVVLDRIGNVVISEQELLQGTILPSSGNFSVDIENNHVLDQLSKT
jgi:tetratricopeptide (TPR) repeat protein